MALNKCSIKSRQMMLNVTVVLMIFISIYISLFFFSTCFLLLVNYVFHLHQAKPNQWIKLGTVNFLNIRTPKKFVVITLKIELCGSTIE